MIHSCFQKTPRPTGVANTSVKKATSNGARNSTEAAEQPLASDNGGRDRENNMDVSRKPSVVLTSQGTHKGQKQLVTTAQKMTGEVATSLTLFSRPFFWP